jgi:hypothetical protein
MVETFTPAVCGSRRRQHLALAGFALGALVASALVGAALGAAGSFLGMPLALGAAAVALVAAAREAGILRLPLPQSRRQVPERWRAELPLPAWSVGYGAGLGAGFLTFQPVATFWVACTAALALGRPLAASLCFTAYGAGRALMALWPRRGQVDPTAAVEALARRRQVVVRANVAALLACAALLAAAPAAGAAVVSLGPGLDPAAAESVLARARMDSGSSLVLVEPSGESPMSVAHAAGPSVDGDLLAYADGGGIKVINWRTGSERAQVDGAVSKPALDWPLLAFIRRDSSYERLILADFTNAGAPTERQIAATLLANDLGRPALRAGRLAWHTITNRESRVTVQRLATGRRTLIARSKIAVEANPSLDASRIVWIEQRAHSSALRKRRFDRRVIRTIYSTTGRDRLLWTTALLRRTAYVTRWSLTTGASTLVRVTF